MLACALVAVMGCGALPAAAASSWMPTAEVRPRMRGVARTVVRGTAVESFDIEVLSVIPGAGASGDLILVRASGPLIQKTGGIAAGMSGSPVFVNGRLVGAIGFGWAFADHSLGLVTPIESMLRALPDRRADRRRIERLALRDPVYIAGRRIDEVAIAPSLEVARRLDRSESATVAMVPLAIPLLVSGLGPRAVQLLGAELGPLGVTPIAGVAGGSTDARPDLVPGSAIGVQLVRGDLNVLSIGTLTYRQGDAMLAFGHPFLNRGRTGYLLTSAVIHDVVQSASFPFKIGSAGAPIGIVSEDRRAGIGGRVGTLPPMVGIRTVVTDGDRGGRTVTVGTRIVRDAQLGPLLALISALEAVDRALDRVGEGTARVRMTLRGRGLDGVVVRENVFYHSRDVGSAAMLELPEGLRLLFSNEFIRTTPVDVTIEVDVRQSRQTAAVIEAEVDRTRVRRGDTVGVRVTLRPFQGAPETRTVEIAVPEAFPAGGATVLVRAGGRPMPEQGLPALLSLEPLEPPAGSAADQLSAFADRDRNTDIIVELIPGAARFPDASGGTSARATRVRMPTPWVIRGRVQVPITVDAR
ncbi:MAG: SpoIVB peptidase S55 domain-containing protein [Armatimonadota bacterium]